MLTGRHIRKTLGGSFRCQESTSGIFVSWTNSLQGHQVEQPNAGNSPLCGHAYRFWVDGLAGLASFLLWGAGEVSLMTVFNHPLFWRMKFKIGVLTLATFAALC